MDWYRPTRSPPRRQRSLCRNTFWTNWGNGTRAEFIPDAEAYACAGALSLLPDYRWERPRPAYAEVDDLAHPDLDLRVRINTVIEMRRAIDLLLSRADVDPKRVAYVGHSFGAQWGAILSSVDSRVKCAVLMAGAAEEGDLWLRSDNPRITDLRATLPRGQLEAYVTAVAGAQCNQLHQQFANPPTAAVWKFRTVF